MIQRVQTLFLILTGIVSVLPIKFLNFWSTNTIEFFATTQKELLYLSLGTIVLSFITLFFFKNRKIQLKLNLLNIGINLCLIGVLIFNLLNLSGGEKPEKGIGLIIPFVAVVFLILAQRAIIKDEKLVKSVDRIR